MLISTVRLFVTQELSEGENDDTTEELDATVLGHHTDNSNDENDIDEETM